MKCPFKQIENSRKKVRLAVFPTRVFFLLFQFLAVSVFCYSQRNPFRVYTVEDGLITLSPQHIFQDNDGFIWIGGHEGLSIYDGNHFTNFSTENKGLSENFVNFIFQEDKGEVWVLHANGIDVFVNRRFKQTLPVKGLAFMLRTTDGRLIGTGTGGIYEFTNNKPHLIFSSQKFLYGLVEIGDYFLGTQIPRESLSLFDHSFHLLNTFNKPGTLFHNFWYQTGDKINVLDTNTIQKKGIIRLIPGPARLRKINDSHFLYPFIDSDGFIWVSSDKGVTRIDKDGSIRRYNLSNGLGRNITLDFFEDVEGNIWAATDGYIKFFNKDVDVFSLNEGLSQLPVWSIAEDSAHSIWLAQSDKMVNLKQNNSFSFRYPRTARKWPSIPKIMVRADTLWLASDGLWLFKIHYGQRPWIELKRKWIYYHHKKLFYAYEYCPSGLSTYRDGTLLVSFGDDLYHVTKGGRIEQIGKSKFYKFLGSGDEVWSGAVNYGVSRWKIVPEKGSLKLVLIKQYDNVPGVRALSITKDSSGNIWAGTLYKGMIKFEKRRDDSFLIRNYDIHNGLPGDKVNKILIDHTGTLFVYTTQGFCILHVGRDTVYAEDLNHKYGFYGTLEDMIETKNGDVWLAAQTGAVRIRKMQQRKNLSPRTFITGLFCNNKPDTSFVHNRNVHPFSYNQNNLSFEFTATSFRNEEEVLYSYQLQSDKTDSTWSQPKKIHQVSFASLSSGHYTFRVKALTPDDVWSKTPAEYSFIINPPYYETWWFRAAIIFLIVGLVSGLFRYRINQVRKLLALRTKISRDLHDEIGSALTSINILSTISTSSLKRDSAKTSELLGKITEQSQDIQQSMSDIVWAIRPDNDKLENVAIRMREYLGQTAEVKGHSVELKVDENILRDSLGMQERMDLFLIFKEAVNNAVKYSNGKNIIVSLKRESHRVKLSVKDDGVGFNPDENSTSNGLRNMRDRARDLNGTLTIQSEPGKGTTVEFDGPTT